MWMDARGSIFSQQANHFKQFWVVFTPTTAQTLPKQPHALQNPLSSEQNLYIMRRGANPVSTHTIESLNLLVPAAATAGGGPGEVGLVERQGSSILKPGEGFRSLRRVSNVGASHQKQNHSEISRYKGFLPSLLKGRGSRRLVTMLWFVLLPSGQKYNKTIRERHSG